MHCFAFRSHLIFFAFHFILFLVFLEFFPIASSWKITKKCPYGHYYNDGCVSCWCDMNSGQTTCQRSSSCNRVNVKCPNGKLYKDQCGNDCNCYEETGAVYCNNNNPQCIRKVDPTKKEEVENNKSTTMKPAITTQIPKVIPLKNDYQIIQPLVLRRSATLINNQPASGSMDYGTANRKQNAFNLYEKIRKMMSKKIKETIQDVINEELGKPLGNMFHQSFSPPVMLENSKTSINYPLEYRRSSISHTPGKATKTVSETIDDEIPTSTSTYNREIFMKPPTNSEAATAPTKMTHPIFNYGRRSENFKEVETIREPLFNSEGSESQKVLTFLRPTSSHQMLSYSGDHMKLHLPNSFSTPASPRPFTYKIPNFPYKAGSDMNFQEPIYNPSSPLPSSFTFESSTLRPGSERVHQNTLRPPVYNIILNSTPRPYLHDNQSYSPKPIIHEFEKNTLQPSYRDNIMYSTPKPTFLESITNSPMPDFQQSTLQPSIYDFQENSRKHSIYSTQQPIRDFQTIHSSSTPSSFVYDFPESAYIQKPLKSNFPQTAPKIPHPYTTNVQNKVPKPIIRLIFQQNTPRPFVFPGYNRIPTIKPANSNYFRTTSISDPSRFTFHQMTTKRPMSIIRVHPNSHRLYQSNYNFNPHFRPTITSISPTMMSTPSVPISNGKGSQFVYIFHETKPHIYPQKSFNNFPRQPLMQNPTSLIHHYIPPPSSNRFPINLARNTPKPIAIPMVTETRKNIVSSPTFDYADTPIRYSSSTPSYFDHLSPTPLANRLEDEIPKPVNLDFQDHTPEHFNFDTNTKPLQQPVSNSNTNYRKPVILKYKNWVSVASTPLPRIVSTTASTTTRRPKIISTQRRPVDIPYTPAASQSTPIIRIHNHGTRTDNIDYNHSHKIDSDNNPINYFNDQAPSTISSVVNYDYGPEKKTMASSAEESEINHEEMIPKELILDPQSGPMRVIFDHDNGQESLKFSDRKGQDGLVTFLQDKPNHPIVVDVDKSLKKPVDVDLGDILVKEPEEEYKPVLVDLEKEQRKTPIIVIKGESGNKNVHREYKEENRNNPPENQNEAPSYYENYERNQEDKENNSDEQVDGDFIAEPSGIVTIQNQDDSYNLRESQDNMGNNEEIISMDQFETSYKNEPVVYADADVNHQEPNTFIEREHTQLQETPLINDYEEQSDTQIEEQIQSQHNSEIESSSPRNVYITNQEQSYYDTSGERDLAVSPVSMTPITFDFPHTASTPATTFRQDHFDTMYEYDSDINTFPGNQQQQFAHKSGQEMLSELPLVENKGSILSFKFAKDETFSKKPLLVSFKKQGRPPRANGYLKTDAVADVFSFYHKMRQESAKRAAAVAEKKRLEFPSDTTSEVDYYRSKGSRRSTFADNNNETRKVSRGTSDSDGDNDRKRSPVHSTDKVEANTRVDSNERDNARSRSDSSTHNSYKNLGSKLDWKLEIEV